MPPRPMASTGCWSLTTEPHTIDARGLKCPLPVLKMEKRIAALSPGAHLLVLATDPMARVDIPLFCKQHGHACDVAAGGDVLRFAIVKG